MVTQKLYLASFIVANAHLLSLNEKLSITATTADMKNRKSYLLSDKQKTGSDYQTDHLSTVQTPSYRHNSKTVQFEHIRHYITRFFLLKRER